MTDRETEQEDTDPGSWVKVGRGRGTRGSVEKRQQSNLLNIPGALGLMHGVGARQQQQRQQQLQGGPVGHYPKVVSRRAGFRQINCCRINIGNVKTGPNKTIPSDSEIDMFLLNVCKLNIVDISKISIMRNRQEVWVTFNNEILANEF